MRKKIRGLCLFLSVWILTLSVTGQDVYAQRALDVARERGYKLEERYQPQGSIITEVNTGQILWQENADVSWPPASMTKLMAILLAYDAIDQGKFTIDTEVPVTEKYVDISGRYELSNNVMKMGASYTVGELIELIIVPSSAAATYMLADMIEPDPDKFVEMMNERAKELGMTQTTYYNCVGVRSSLLYPYQPVNIPQDADNKTSPIDYAILCTYFVKNYPDILNHTKYAELTVKPGTPYEEHFSTYHFSLEGAKHELKGTDGLKTGSSGTAGFNYSSTAKRGDTRLVEVVMGVSNWEDQTGEEIRHLVGNAIMEQAFEQYEYKKVLPKGTHTIDGQQIVTKKDLWDCVPKGQEELPLTLKDGKVSVDLERSYLPGHQAPEVSYKDASEAASEKKQKDGGSFWKTFVKVITVTVITLVAAFFAAVCYIEYKKEQRRRRRRRRRQNRESRERRHRR